jgi:hypothetical protein
MTNWSRRFPSLCSLLAGADHVDVTTVVGPGELRPFLAGMLAWEPRWVRFLFAVRSRLVRLIGLRQEGHFRAPHFHPADVPMTPGRPAAFFTVRLADEERYWAADVEERHLRAALCVVREGERFSLVTIVHYRHWTGPLYFNVIRPFHHLVVWCMAHAGLAAAQTSG